MMSVRIIKRSGHAIRRSAISRIVVSLDRTHGLVVVDHRGHEGCHRRTDLSIIGEGKTDAAGAMFMRVFSLLIWRDFLYGPHWGEPAAKNSAEKPVPALQANRRGCGSAAGPVAQSFMILPLCPSLRHSARSIRR
jgi:hypothetical protein